MKKSTFIVELILIGLVVFLINTFLFQICFVRGSSMEPTLRNGQILIAQKYNVNPQKNDIVVVRKDKKTIIKRTVGVPKDKISIIDGYVYVNGEKFDNMYIENPGNAINEIFLKENEYFVLGDNRNNSIDSRFDEIGIINKQNIIGKIILQKNMK